MSTASRLTTITAPLRLSPASYDSAEQRSTRLWSALGELRGGRPIILADDIGGTGCDLVTAAATATARSVHRLVRWGSGFVCVTVDLDTCDRLELPPMTWRESASDYTGSLCVSVDAVAGTTTGISAADRATTARRLADPTAGPADLTRPGHVVPVLADGFTSAMPTRASAASALIGLAGLGTSAVFSALVSTGRPTEMATPDEILGDADSAAAPVISYTDLVSALPDARSAHAGVIS